MFTHSKTNGMNIQSPSLYEELGPELLKSLVTEFYDRVYAHPRIQHLFKNDKSEVMDKQYCFLTQFFGGPSLYSQQYGPPRMRRRHMPHPIREGDKNDWLYCMQEAINALPITQELKERVFASFPMLAAHMVNRQG